MHGLSVVRRWASTEKKPTMACGAMRAFISTGLYAFGVGTAVHSGEFDALHARCGQPGRSTSGGGQHQPRPARVGRGMWAAGAFHVRGRAASAKACARRTLHVGIGQACANQGRAARVQSKCASAVAYLLF